MTIRWLGRALVEAIHEEQISVPGGGTSGLRNPDGLEAALTRPKRYAAYSDPDIVELAAIYATGILRNHPFVDANKRTAFLAAYVFLAENGYDLSVPEGEVVLIMHDLAAGDVSEAEFAEWLRRALSAG